MHSLDVRYTRQSDIAGLGTECHYYYPHVEVAGECPAQ
jgi:hypothetical protein